MKALIFYRSNSEHERQVEVYARDFTRQTGKQLEMVDVNTRGGASRAHLYDVMRFPSILATDDDGRMLQLWQNDLLPRFDEVSYYVQS